MSISNNFRDKDNAAWKENVTDGGTDRRTCDITTHDKLDTLTEGLGATDTATTILNVAIATSNTEVSQILPANTKKFSFRSRSRGRIQLAYSVGESGSNYITIIPGNVYTDQNFYGAQTIYFQSTKSGDTLELIVHV
jgi:hypothetical protein